MIEQELLQLHGGTCPDCGATNGWKIVERGPKETTIACEYSGTLKRIPTSDLPVAQQMRSEESEQRRVQTLVINVLQETGLLHAFARFTGIDEIVANNIFDALDRSSELPFGQLFRLNMLLRNKSGESVWVLGYLAGIQEDPTEGSPGGYHLIIPIDPSLVYFKCDDEITDEGTLQFQLRLVRKMNTGKLIHDEMMLPQRVKLTSTSGKAAELRISDVAFTIGEQYDDNLKKAVQTENKRKSSIYKGMI